MNAADDKMLVTLTAADLRQLVREEVERGMREQSNPVVRASPWVDVRAAARHFGRTPQTIRNWIRAGAPARQIGTTARPQFRIHLEQFEAWMQALHETRGVATK